MNYCKECSDPLSSTHSVLVKWLLMALKDNLISTQNIRGFPQNHCLRMEKNSSMSQSCVVTQLSEKGSTQDALGHRHLAILSIKQV